MSDLIDRKELGAAIDNWLAIDRYYHPYSKQKTIPVSELVDIIKLLPSAQSEWNNHEVACLLAELFDDDCACNFNGIDEWLPLKCDFAKTRCPYPVGVACWEQYLKHRAERRTNE